MGLSLKEVTRHNGHQGARKRNFDSNDLQLAQIAGGFPDRLPVEGTETLDAKGQVDLEGCFPDRSPVEGTER